MKLFFFGCYINKYTDGANLGDYMYKEVFEYYFKKYNPIIDHKNHFEKRVHEISPSDLVIFGGGGLLYDSIENIKVFEKITHLLKIKKIKYIIFSVGLQLKHCDYNINNIVSLSNNNDTKLFIPFIRNAYKIYVRSIYDQDVLSQYNTNTYYYPDLCFSLYKINFLNKKTNNIKKKNLITIGSYRHIEKHSTYINQLIDLGFQHYHLIFSNGDLFDNEKWKLFRDNDYKPNILKENSIKNYQSVFENAAYVYTSRFHGYLFAKLCNVEHVVPLLPTYKIVNYNNFSEELSFKSIKMLEIDILNNNSYISINKTLNKNNFDMQFL